MVLAVARAPDVIYSGKFHHTTLQMRNDIFILVDNALVNAVCQ